MANVETLDQIGLTPEKIKFNKIGLPIISLEDETTFLLLKNTHPEVYEEYKGVFVPTLVLTNAVYVANSEVILSSDVKRISDARDVVEEELVARTVNPEYARLRMIELFHLYKYYTVQLGIIGFEMNDGREVEEGILVDGEDTDFDPMMLDEDLTILKMLGEDVTTLLKAIHIQTPLSTLNIRLDESDVAFGLPRDGVPGKYLWVDIPENYVEEDFDSGRWDELDIPSTDFDSPTEY